MGYVKQQRQDTVSEIKKQIIELSSTLGRLNIELSGLLDQSSPSPDDPSPPLFQAGDTIQIVKKGSVGDGTIEGIISGTKVLQSRRKRRQSTDNDDRPKTSDRFEQEWRQYCASPRDTLCYLTVPQSSEETLSARMKAPLSLIDLAHRVSAEDGRQQRRRLRIVPEEIPQSACRVEMDNVIFCGVLDALRYLLSLFTSDFGRELGRDDRLSAAEDGGESEERAPVHTHRNRARRFVYRWMRALSRTGRFRLNVAFLTVEQRGCVRHILAELEKKDFDADKLTLREDKGTDYVLEDLRRLRVRFECTS